MHYTPKLHRVVLVLGGMTAHQGWPAWGIDHGDRQRSRLRGRDRLDAHGTVYIADGPTSELLVMKPAHH